MVQTELGLSFHSPLSESGEISSCDSGVLKILKELNLEEYAPVFAREQIQSTDFVQLSDGDFEKLGIRLGHRKRLLSAAKKMAIPGVPLSPVEEDVVPNEFYCPITMEMMSDPVVAGDGFSYERDAISSWLRHKQVSPMTNEPLKSKEIVPNKQLKKLIDDCKCKHGIYKQC